MIFSARGMTACLNPAECVRKRSLRVLCAARETGKAKRKRTATSRSHRGAENTNLAVGITEKTVSFMIAPLLNLANQAREEFKHFIHHGDTEYTEMHGEL